MLIKGKVFKFGNDINTDDIISARYLNTIDPKELGSHCMEILDHDFPKKVKLGDIVVAGNNFGCGSSREHAPIALKGCGVTLVIAKSFARIFYRNAINLGLPVIVFNQSHEVNSGDNLKIDLLAGRVENLTRELRYNVMPLPPHLMAMITDGGLIPHLKNKFLANLNRPGDID